MCVCVCVHIGLPLSECLSGVDTKVNQSHITQ